MKRYLIVTAMAMLLASCSSNEQANGVKTNSASNVVKLRTEGNAQVFKSEHWLDKGKVWIPAERAAALLNYRYALKEGNHMAAMGYSDPLYVFTADSKQAKIGEDSVILSEAPRMIGQSLCLELGSLSQLLQTPVKWDGKHQTVVVGPPKNRDPQRTPAVGMPGSTLRTRSVDSNSADNPDNAANDNNADNGDTGTNAGSDTGTSDNADTAKADEVIAYAERYMDTPYKFDAAPYEQSHKFDCSSFMQHVFDHFGIDLPRSSKAQSKIGKYVTRNNLQKGDIVFFYTPGRYSSNEIVGHVGLYIGNNKVIQTYGDPGVTITSLEGNWDKRILWARRVL
ncbi:C40 family peptidase [Paenibacillus rhizovicinus]|uniref:C40 family peptidase n=1 Tax=Paenibacillus rhizovicinus TaxID=2704463 RepID=A0A6C0NVT8_9BACL|nr:C40 family peptidase [Paenibacillus rhizovicinus]QHW30324.1 C40 family peptidase [Paenibacillus rhizovicinus]